MDSTKGGKDGKYGKEEGCPANKRRRGGARTNHSYDKNNNFISEEYICALCAQATLLSKPIPLSMSGVVSLFLDENNHIQHMNIRNRPI